MIGETIGNYKVVSLLGAGGMGEVYLAEQLAIETRVAIKILQTHISKDADQVQRFFNEARAVSKVRHAGTVKIFDVGFHKGHAFLVMEFLDGESLSSRIRRLGNLPGDQVADIGRQIAGVLDAVHTAGVTHRDLKPDNIYLVPDSELASGERVKVLDFGIAKLTGTLGGNSPQTKGTMGTPAYMAPEQWNNASTVDGRADTYSLGCVMFELACGRPPFPATSVGEACTHHLHSAPPLASSVVPQVPPQFDALVERMLAKTANARPTIKEVARAFDELKSSGASGRWSGSQSIALATTMPPTHGHGSNPSTEPTQMSPAPAQAPPTVLPSTSRVATPAIAAPVAPTTMPSGEVHGQRSGGGPKGVIFAVVAVVLVGGVTAIVLASKSSPSSTGSGTGSQPMVAAIDAGHPIAIVDAASALPSPRERFAKLADGGFFDVGSVAVSRQITNETYATILGRPAAGGKDWQAPIASLTQHEAAELCAAIGARLPTSHEWARAANGGWGIRIPTGKGFIQGPLQEWTSTIQDELAVVRGGHAAMSPAALAKAGKQTPPYFLQKEVTGDRAVTTGQTIGFRCVDDGERPRPATPSGEPGDFVDVAKLIPDAVIELHYATTDNFVGEVLYPKSVCKLRRSVADRLIQAADALRKQDRRLLLWDCYRPTSVHARMWKKVPDARYVADPKTGGSNHSRGAAIDLALVDNAGKPITLPTSFDEFSKAAHREYALVGNGGIEARRLADAMAAAGFTPNPYEWWHYDASDSAKYSPSDEPL